MTPPLLADVQVRSTLLGQAACMRPIWVQLRRWSGVLVGPGLFALIVLAFVATAVPDVVAVRDVVWWVWLLCLVVWLVAIVGAWWTLGQLRWGIFTPARRRTHLPALFDQGVDASRQHGVSLVRVRRRYQYARQGTKAIVEHVDGTRQDAWFWHARPRARGVHVVRGSGSYGPHTHALNVFYVGSRTTGHGLVWSLPRATWRAARRRARDASRR